MRKAFLWFGAFWLLSVGFAAPVSAAYSRRESLGLGFALGRTQETLDANGKQISQDRDSVRGLDLNWMFHKRFLHLSYALLLRERRFSTPRGKLNFMGGGFGLGYYSNTFEDPKRWPIGWHTFFSFAMGPASKVSSMYDQAPFAAMADWNFGIDWKVKGWKSPDSDKIASAFVVSFDDGVEAQSIEMSTKTTPKQGAFFQADGWIPKLSLAYYW